MFICLLIFLKYIMFNFMANNNLKKQKFFLNNTSLKNKNGFFYIIKIRGLYILII